MITGFEDNKRSIWDEVIRQLNLVLPNFIIIFFCVIFHNVYTEDYSLTIHFVALMTSFLTNEFYELQSSVSIRNNFKIYKMESKLCCYIRYSKDIKKETNAGNFMCFI